MPVSLAYNASRAVDCRIRFDIEGRATLYSHHRSAEDARYTHIRHRIVSARFSGRLLYPGSFGTLGNQLVKCRFT
jgi:hypothetical protein